MQLLNKKICSWPLKETCQMLLEKYHTPNPVRIHCEAVANRALELAAQVKGIEVDLGLLQAACELHDIARATGREHAKNGADWLIFEGYPDVAAVISVHHDLPADAAIEAQLLYLADKLVQGDRYVSLEDRFAHSREKCQTDDALNSWQRQLKITRLIIERYHLDVN